MTTSKGYVSATAQASIALKKSQQDLNEKRLAILDGQFLAKEEVMREFVQFAANTRQAVLDLAPQIKHELGKVIQIADAQQSAKITEAIETATFAMLQRLADRANDFEVEKSNPHVQQHAGVAVVHATPTGRPRKPRKNGSVAHAP